MLCDSDPKNLAIFLTRVLIDLILKVSQNWFSGSQQIFVTVILAFSPLLGTMVAQAITPVMVTSPDEIPTMNWVWSILSTLSMIMFIFLVRTSLPPTPPSKSAEISTKKMPYLKR